MNQSTHDFHAAEHMDHQYPMISLSDTGKPLSNCSTVHEA